MVHTNLLRKCREACDFYYVCDHSKSSNMGTNKIMHM